MALIISSVFYNMNSDTGSFTQRGTLLFFAILLSAFASALEVRSRVLCLLTVLHTLTCAFTFASLYRS